MSQRQSTMDSACRKTRLINGPDSHAYLPAHRYSHDVEGSVGDPHHELE